MIGDETTLRLRIIEICGGGFVIAQELDDHNIEALQAVSTMDEACGVIQRRTREWHLEARAYRRAQFDEGNVIRPVTSFWRKLFKRADTELEEVA